MTTPVRDRSGRSASRSRKTSAQSTTDAKAIKAKATKAKAKTAKGMDAKATKAKAIKAKKTKKKAAPTKATTGRKSRASTKVKEMDVIAVRGAREHNLKTVDIDIPKKRLVVFSGVSGSGKSSMAFDTIFAEGQRRYVESLSTYARQFLGQMDKPLFETIRGLSPTISIEQKSQSNNPRSTVATITEIYDYLRVLFARVGQQYCVKCGKKVGKGDAAQMVEQILALPAKTKLLILAPLVDNRKGEHKDMLAALVADGFSRVRIDGTVVNLADVQALAKNKKHSIELVVDRLVVTPDDQAFRTRLTDSVEQALKAGKGRIIAHSVGGRDLIMSEEASCCQIAYPKMEPTLFSFNSPKGMCPDCNGIGTIVAMDVDKLIPDPSLSIEDGAIIPWQNYFNGTGEGSWGYEKIMALRDYWDIDFSCPWQKLPKKHRDLILYGDDGQQQISINFKGDKAEGTWTTTYEGLLNTLMRRYLATKSDSMKTWYGKFMSSKSCKTCDGQRLNPHVLNIRIGNESIADVCRMTIEEAADYASQLKLSANQMIIASELLKEITSRLGFLVNVGLSYLTLDRTGPTLSGGESQRIRLASQVGSELTGVLYILDEPSIGLHQRDNERLLATLCHLRDIGNSLIVVEHDQDTLEQADWVVDFGPGAGALGGEVVASGTLAQLKKNRKSLTGAYLSGRKTMFAPPQRRSPDLIAKRKIKVTGAKENNLKNVTVEIPVGNFVCVTGVSGAGKSTLINQILYPVLANKLHNSQHTVGRHSSVAGVSLIDKVVYIDQKPIGRTPRSNPATYTKVFDHIRDFFAGLPESKERGFAKGRFSFNVKGGRCEACQGDGYIKVEMHFLADVYVPCEQCDGKRFNRATLEVTYKGHTIADILNLSVREAAELFANHTKIKAILDTLAAVGLTYIKLGQPATTLSGGEAQRIKLSRELAKRDTGKTFYILDEPTTGLHFADIDNLLKVLHTLVDHGNTVLVIEHNLDVIKTADWVIDIGPEGGNAGGEVIAAGTPEQVAKAAGRSHTGRFLAPLL